MQLRCIHAGNLLLRSKRPQHFLLHPASCRPARRQTLRWTSSFGPRPSCSSWTPSRCSSRRASKNHLRWPSYCGGRRPSRCHLWPIFPLPKPLSQIRAKSTSCRTILRSTYSSWIFRPCTSCKRCIRASGVKPVHSSSLCVPSSFSPW